MALLAALLATSSPVVAEEAETLLDEEIRVRHFVEMQYPLAAWLKAQTGLAVVRAKLDAEGTVIQAEALSGPRLVLKDVLANVKKWRFAPSKKGQAIVIYDFRMEDSCQSPCRSQFLWRAPNVAVIRRGVALVQAH